MEQQNRLQRPRPVDEAVREDMISNQQIGSDLGTTGKVISYERLTKTVVFIANSS